MTIFDGKENNAKSTLDGALASGEATLDVQTGDGVKFPNPAIANYNCTIWSAATYPDPSDDPNMEVVRVTARSTDEFTVTRAQEGTAEIAHSDGDAFRLLITKKALTDIESVVNTLEAGVVYKAGAQTITGVKSFSVFPITPSSAPTTNYQVANKKYVDDNVGVADGWIDANETWTYASASTITVPAGAASKYQIGDKIKWTQTTVRYGVIITVADTLLTIAVNTDYVVTDAAISANFYSHQLNPIGFPKDFAGGTPPFPLLSSKVKVDTRDLTAASGDVGYTGIGFKPTSIICISGLGGGVLASWGVVDSAKVASLLRKDTVNFFQGNYLVYCLTSGGNEQRATVKSYDTDGFTLTWTKTGSPTGTLNLMFLCLR